jgi:hypothetical protein
VFLEKELDIAHLALGRQFLRFYPAITRLLERGPASSLLARDLYRIFIFKDHDL